MMFNALMTFFQHFKSWTEAHESDPFAEFADYVPEAPQTPFHVVRPGKYRPYVITSHTTHLEAVLALELVAASFAADGWFVHRDAPGLWRLYKCVDGEDLISRLEIVTSESLVQIHV